MEKTSQPLIYRADGCTEKGYFAPFQATLHSVLAGAAVPGAQR